MFTIRRGSRGVDVKRWQRIINVKDDGVFGRGTELATKQWQTRHSLTPDGIVGPKTWTKALEPKSTTAPVTANMPSPESPSTPTKSVQQNKEKIMPSTTRPTLRLGSTGERVKEWQRIISVSDDGKFGRQTASATKDWQRKHGLTPDGIVGKASWTKADEVSAPKTGPKKVVAAVKETVKEKVVEPAKATATLVKAGMPLWQKIVSGFILLAIGGMAVKSIAKK